MPSPRPRAPDYQALFDAAPGRYLLLAPNLTVAAANDAYAKTVMRAREKIVGRAIFDVFPDPQNPAGDGVVDLRASLDRVLWLQRPDALVVRKSAARAAASANCRSEEQYWSVLNTPVAGADGEVEWIIHRIEDAG